MLLVGTFRTTQLKMPQEVLAALLGAELSVTDFLRIDKTILAEVMSAEAGSSYASYDSALPMPKQPDSAQDGELDIGDVEDDLAALMQQLQRGEDQADDTTEAGAVIAEHHVIGVPAGGGHSWARGCPCRGGGAYQDQLRKGAHRV